MTRDEAIKILYDIKLQFDHSIADGEYGDAYATEVLDYSKNAAIALSMAVASLQEPGEVT